MNIRPYWKPEPRLWDWSFWSLMVPAAVWVIGIIVYGGEALMAADLTWNAQGWGSAFMVVGGELGTLFCVMEVYRKSQAGAANGWDWGGVGVSLISTLGVMLVVFTRQTELAARWIEPVRNWGPLVLLLCSALDFYANVVELGYYRASFEARWERWNADRWNHERREHERIAEMSEPQHEPRQEPQPPRRAAEPRRLTRNEWRDFLATLNGDGADLTPDRVNELLIGNGFASVPYSTARDWAADAPDRIETGSES